MRSSGVHEQDRHPHDTPRFYAWCSCGVCGPLRRSRVTAGIDAHVHSLACRMGRAS
jgi:hypothetical protein